MNAPSFRVSDHAVERALDMCVEGDEIRRAVEHPVDVREAHGGHEVRTAGRIGVVFDPRARLVVTVVWRYASARKTDVRRADHYGREDEWADRTRKRADMRRTKTRTGKVFDGRRSNRRSGSRKKFKEEW